MKWTCFSVSQKKSHWWSTCANTPANARTDARSAARGSPRPAFCRPTWTSTAIARRTSAPSAKRRSGKSPSWLCTCSVTKASGTFLATFVRQNSWPKKILTGIAVLTQVRLLLQYKDTKSTFKVLFSFTTTSSFAKKKAGRLWRRIKNRRRQIR